MVVFSSLVFNPSAFAQTTNGCLPIFGGGPSCLQSGDITLDKKIRNPASNQYVDNLSITDPSYTPEQVVSFQLIIRNTSNRAIENITVTDIFPRYVGFHRGPGQFDRTTNTLTFSIDRIEAGQNRSVTVEGKVSPAQAIPAVNGPLCVVNQARSEKDSRNFGTDNTQFCLTPAGQTTTPGQTTQPPVQSQPQPQPTKPPQTNMPVYEAPGVTTSPNTGPELLALIGLLPAGAMGYYLRKVSSK